MKKYLTKKQVVKMFKEDYAEAFKKGDAIGIRCYWNDYTDMLCKDGQISENQYNNWTNPFDKREWK